MTRRIVLAAIVVVTVTRPAAADVIGLDTDLPLPLLTHNSRIIYNEYDGETFSTLVNLTGNPLDIVISVSGSTAWLTTRSSTGRTPSN